MDRDDLFDEIEQIVYDHPGRVVTEMMRFLDRRYEEIGGALGKNTTPDRRGDGSGDPGSGDVATEPEGD